MRLKLGVMAAGVALLCAACSGGVPEVAEAWPPDRPAAPEGVSSAEWNQSDEILSWALTVMTGGDSPACDEADSDDYQARAGRAFIADELTDRYGRQVTIEDVEAHLAENC